MIDKDLVVGALVTEWAAIDALLSGLDAAQWERATPCPHWSVRDVVGHLIGTERALLGERPAAAEADVAGRAHVHNEIGLVNERWIESQRGESPERLLERFREVTATRGAALAAMSGEDFHASSWTPAGQGTYARFMRIRVFDCWMHEQDIRDAVDRPGHEDGTPAEVAMDEIAEVLGYLVGKRAAVPDGDSVTLVLDGPLRRTLHVLVDGRARVVPRLDGPATASLTLPSGLFTRLCGGRVEPDERALAAVRIDGDQDLGRRVAGSLRFTI